MRREVEFSIGTKSKVFNDVDLVFYKDLCSSNTINVNLGYEIFVDEFVDCSINGYDLLVPGVCESGRKL